MRFFTFILLAVFSELAMCAPSPAGKTFTPIAIPLHAEASIVLFQGVSIFWIQFDHEDEYNAVSKGVDAASRKDASLALIVELFGVKGKHYSEIVFPQKDKQFKYILDLNKQLKKARIKLNCLGYSANRNLSCQAFVGDNKDLANYLLSIGALTTKPTNPGNAELQKTYKATLREAKSKGLGIWEPYYQMNLSQLEKISMSK